MKYLNQLIYNKNNKHLTYISLFSSAGIGCYGFILNNIEKFKKPIKAKGKLGFWEFEE